MKFQPLNGITVVSIEHALSAPLASCRLADAGARVIKVERDIGDFARYYDEVVMGQSTYFVWANRGKESVRIDIKSEQGRILLIKLIKKADVFIQNLAPGALEKQGLNSERFREENPELITCDISGYGEGSDLKAYDNLVQAESGLIDVTGDGEVRAKAGISIADISTGMHAYSAILEALIQRGKTGEGVSIKLSMFDSMADWMMVPWLHQKYGGKAPPRTGVYHAAIAPYGPFRTGDKREIMIGIQNEREWKKFCGEILESELLPGHKKFTTNPARVANMAELNEIIQKKFERLDYNTVLSKLQKAGIAYANLNSMADFENHPKLRLTKVDSESGPVFMADRPAQFKGYDSGFRAVPSLGEHDEQIKKEFNQ